MTKVPLHDFDEANRAEGARNMKNYSSYLAPLTGSPFLRNIDLFVEAKDNPLLKIYYHLERPPLYFLSMVFSSSIIGDNEFSYRLPSFVFGLMAFAVLATATSGAVLPVLTLASGLACAYACDFFGLVAVLPVGFNGYVIVIISFYRLGISFGVYPKKEEFPFGFIWRIFGAGNIEQRPTSGHIRISVIVHPFYQKGILQTGIYFIGQCRSGYRPLGDRSYY